MIREDIYAALFAHLQAVPGLTTTSRRLKHVDEVQPVEFPVAYQVQQDENAQARPAMPTVWTLRAEWWLYSYEPDPNAAPSQKLNPLLDAVTSALDPERPLELTTLGDRVYHACVGGTVEVIEGVMGDRAIAIVPIKITKA